jgi:hypothetical protein
LDKINIEESIENIKDKQFRSWSLEYLNILKKRGFDEAPASRNIHHFFKGGLRAHTEEMLFIGQSIYDACVFDGINLDELMISIIFHDAGKSDVYILVNGEYEHNPNSLIYTKPHDFIRPVDHSDIPILDWDELGFIFPWSVRLAILGHMGGWSVTGVYPDTLLASIVSSADLISSRVGKAGWDNVRQKNVSI